MSSRGIYCMKKLFYYKRNRKDKSIVSIISQHKSTTDTITNMKTRERERWDNIISLVGP